MVNGWKIIAIVFIILFALETAFICWSFNVYNESTLNENKCYTNICGLGTDESDYDAYNYDSIENVCYCFKDGEIVKTSIVE